MPISRRTGRRADGEQKLASGRGLVPAIKPQSAALGERPRLNEHRASQTRLRYKMRRGAWTCWANQGRIPGVPTALHVLPASPDAAPFGEYPRIALGCGGRRCTGLCCCFRLRLTLGLSILRRVAQCGGGPGASRADCNRPVVRQLRQDSFLRRATARSVPRKPGLGAHAYTCQADRHRGAFCTLLLAQAAGRFGDDAIQNGRSAFWEGQTARRGTTAARLQRGALARDAGDPSSLAMRWEG